MSETDCYSTNVFFTIFAKEKCPMKYTLAIESSTVTPSAALLADKELLAESSWDAARGASKRMMTVIQDILAANSITLNDIDLL